MARKQPKPIHQLAIAQFERLFQDEDSGCAYRVRRRWPKGPAARVATRRSSVRSRQCQGTGSAENARRKPLIAFPTPLELSSRILISPLRDWFRGIRVWLRVIAWPRKSWLHGSRQPIHDARWNAKPDRPALILFRKARCSARCFCYPTLMHSATIGLDLAKPWFQVHGVDAAGEVAVKRPLRRTEVGAFFRAQEPCLVGMGSLRHGASLRASRSRWDMRRSSCRLPM
jgi:hypothetical protein